MADILQYGVMAFFEIAGTYFAVNKMYQKGSLISFVLAMLLCILMPNIINLLAFIKSWRLQSTVYMVKNTFF